MRLLTSSDLESGDQVSDDEVIVAVTREELAGLANSIGQTLQAVDAWEFDTLVGLTPDEAKSLRNQISETLRATSAPCNGGSDTRTPNY